MVGHFKPYWSRCGDECDIAQAALCYAFGMSPGQNLLGRKKIVEIDALPE
jgi:hypothetical protein